MNFCIWHLSLTTVLSGSSILYEVPALHSFLFLNKNLICMYAAVVHNSSIAGHLRMWCLWVVVNNIAINRLLCLFKYLFQIFCCPCIGEELLCQTWFYLTFFKVPSVYLPCHVTHFILPPALCKKMQFIHMFNNILWFLFY